MLNFKPVSRRGQRNAEKGQSLVEMTFGLMVLLMIVAGVLDIGRAYFSLVSLEDSAGEAALYMSAFPQCPYDGTDGVNPVANALDVDTLCDPPNNARWRAENAGGSTGLVTLDDARFSITCSAADGSPIPDCADAGNGDYVTVIINYDFPLLSPFIPEINGSPTLGLEGRAVEVITAPKN